MLNPYDYPLTNLGGLPLEPDTGLISALLPDEAGTYGTQLGELGFLLGGGILTGAFAEQLGIEGEVLLTKFFSFWTPGSDYAFGQDYVEFISGREGFDTIIGYDPGLTSAFAPVQIDFVLAGPSLIGAPLNEPARYVLGDWRTPYYVDNNPLSEGLTDFMYVSIISFDPVDFSPANNRLQLHGSLNDYYFVPTEVVIDLSVLSPGLPTITLPGTEIYYKSGQVIADLIAVVPFRDDTDPNLISAWIDFEGYLPPELADLNALTSASYQEVSAAFFGPISPLLQLGNEGIDMGAATALAPDGDLYVGGSTSSILGLFPRGGSDNFIARYNDDGSVQWIVQFGSTEFDTLTDIVSDSAGNVYATGWTRGDVETGFGLAPGIQDNWVAKFDANGNQLWVEQFTIDGYLDRSMSIALDETNGKVYLTGHSNTDGLVDDTNQAGIDPNGDVVTWIASFDATTGAENYRNVFEVAQTSNARGRIDEGFGVAVDGSGNVFSTGWAGDISYDVYLTKFDPTGAELWTKSFGTGDGITQSYAWDVASDGTNAYILGWTQDTLDTFRDQIPPTDEFGGNATQLFTPDNPYRGGTFDAFIASYDASGNERWTWHIGGAGDDGTYLGKIAVAGDYIYATGYTNGFIGTLGGSNAGDYDAWIGKFNKDTGVTAWIQQIGSTKLDYATGISVDGDDIFVTGFTEGSLGRFNGGASDVWVAKLNQAGALESFNASANAATTPITGLESLGSSYSPYDYTGGIESLLSSYGYTGGIESLGSSYGYTGGVESLGSSYGYTGGIESLGSQPSYGIADLGDVVQSVYSNLGSGYDPTSNPYVTPASFDAPATYDPSLYQNPYDYTSYSGYGY